MDTVRAKIPSKHIRVSTDQTCDVIDRCVINIVVGVLNRTHPRNYIYIYGYIPTLD